MVEGDTINYLTMVSKCPITSSNKHRYAMFQCVCGKIKKIRIDCVSRGTTKSCGCVRKPSTYHTHGDSIGGKRTRLFKIYAKMKERCYNSNYPEPQYYSQRGIIMCDEWKNDYMAFKNWALSHGYADNLSIDRIDNNKGYSPENCRWADCKTQSRNRRSNRTITYNGITKILIEWCEDLHLNYSTILMRIKRGWDVERALSEPIKKLK